MKKLISCIIITAAVLSAGTITAFASQPVGNNTTCMGRGYGLNFVDSDNDGICDNFASTKGMGRGFGKGMGKRINFVDNKIDQNSGSVTMRATFDNSKGWLVPGAYMKVKLIAPQLVEFMTVPQACTKGDAMSGYYVWAVDKNNKAVRKNIEVSDDINNNWIVEDGLKMTDVIVVSGIQNVSQEGQKLKTITNQSEKE